MRPNDQEKTFFMTESYHYKVMLFELKNAKAAY